MFLNKKLKVIILVFKNNYTRENSIFAMIDSGIADEWVWLSRTVFCRVSCKPIPSNSSGPHTWSFSLSCETNTSPSHTSCPEEADGPERTTPPLWRRTSRWVWSSVAWVRKIILLLLLFLMIFIGNNSEIIVRILCSNEDYNNYRNKCH